MARNCDEEGSDGARHVADLRGLDVSKPPTISEQPQQKHLLDPCGVRLLDRAAIGDWRATPPNRILIGNSDWELCGAACWMPILESDG